MSLSSLSNETAGTNAAAEPATPSGDAPTWLQEIFPAGGRNGFYEKSHDHALAFVERSRRQLVVSFDNLSDAGNPNYDVEPWAGKFVHDQGWSHLGVFARGPTWYRDMWLIDQFARLAESGFFRRFERVALIGTSMGGFGALAFSEFAPGATVVALSPQSTLEDSIVPWDKRFAKGRVQDWSLPCSDAAISAEHAGRIFALYDPAVEHDLRHVDRLPQDRLVRLKGFWFGHKSAVVLRRIDQLKPFMTAAITGTLTEPMFYRMIRGRRNLLIYRRAVEAELDRRGQTERMERFRTAFRRRRLEQKAKSTEQGE
ncbi:hypothetical protein GQ651_10175 [Alphaproteobacteria bacterium GH1-50]|uniref:Esterase n=1 Tax=Kangsaoukella pontilimi TaxID=2691042 RepID=A0A7C9IGR5_9RHOB|nr:hypothetical protein [Kangsaoukella pontilimi]MXQ08209.1 hypothetical protein [Kangsaoukella pontilimi]